MAGYSVVWQDTDWTSVVSIAKIRWALGWSWKFHSQRDPLWHFGYDAGIFLNDRGHPILWWGQRVKGWYIFIIVSEWLIASDGSLVMMVGINSPVATSSGMDSNSYPARKRHAVWGHGSSRPACTTTQSDLRATLSADKSIRLFFYILVGCDAQIWLCRYAD